MGPVLQERATLAHLSDTEKVRMKNAQNAGVVDSYNKRGGGGGHVNQNKKPVRKTAISHPGRDKNPEPKAAIVHNGMKAKKVKSPTGSACKLRSTQGEADLKPPRPKLSCHDRHKASPETPPTRPALDKSRRPLSLPLPPQPLLRHIPLPKHVPDLESLRLLEHNEDDTDSASDLSDSERLPVLPSPCTPPQLNLRAEVIRTLDLHPIPGPRATAHDGYSDFLPPPFNTWSLRQLAIFLNTEGKRAPRPKPVGQLERYLERLLQLEWHQIQTAHAESGRKSHAPQAARPRPHTAPPTRLSSPKSLRPSSISSPSSSQLSRSICPHCHARYPLCNGSCSSHVYQRHSRLSPLMERRAPPTAADKRRSNSESRDAAARSPPPIKGQQKPTRRDTPKPANRPSERRKDPPGAACHAPARRVEKGGVGEERVRSGGKRAGVDASEAKRTPAATKSTRHAKNVQFCK